MKPNARVSLHISEVTGQPSKRTRGSAYCARFDERRVSARFDLLTDCNAARQLTSKAIELNDYRENRHSVGKSNKFLCVPFSMTPSVCKTEVGLFGDLSIRISAQYASAQNNKLRNCAAVTKIDFIEILSAT